MSFYLYIFEDGSSCQKEHLNDEEISQEDVDSIDQGLVDIYKHEPTRGFVRAQVGTSEDDEDVLAIVDWEMVERR